MNDIPLVLTPEMLAQILMLGRNTTYELLRNGEIESIRIGRQYRITKDALLEYLAKTTGSVL